MDNPDGRILRHIESLSRCKRCPKMKGPVVTGKPVVSPVMLVGQAPGSKEIELHRPFAWTAGKTLFKWFLEIGLEEDRFRDMVYMAAVCRCFPGKNPRGGDRVPDKDEMSHCSDWLEKEFRILKPKLLLPVGKLAISRFMPVDRLDKVVGKIHSLEWHGLQTDLIPLPHPSGASVWHRVEPGKSLLKKALRLIKKHPAWRQLIE